MKISIVIPTLDRPLKLNSCLKSLFFAINKNKVIDLEILVIDQSDDSQTKNLCSNYVVNYFHNNIKGLSKARNVGILNSKGEYILFLDDDIEVSSDYFHELFNMIKNNKEVDAFTGKLINKDETSTYSRYQNIKSTWINKNSFHVVLSSGTGIKRSYFEDVGKFDENFGIGEFYGGGEEADLIFRGLKKNKKIFFNSNLISYHPAEISSLNFSVRRFKRGFRYGKGRGALLKKHKDFLNLSSIINNFYMPFLGFFYNILFIKFDFALESLGSFFGRIFGFARYKNK